MLSESPYIALTYTEYNGKKLDKEIRMHPATVVANEVIVNSQFTARLAQDGKGAILTHRDADGKTRSWKVELVLDGGQSAGLDSQKADAIAQLFNECKPLQDSLLGKRASEGPLIINTQKSSDDSIRWQWSTKPLDGNLPAWTSFEVSAKSQEIFTKLFTNVDASRPEASRTSARGLSAATELPSYTIDPKGIPNLGNTCFMNAALQGLLRMPGIGEYLKREDLELAKGSDARRLQTALTSLFDEFEKEKPNSETIKQAATTIRTLPSIANPSSPYGKYVFTPEQQHDSFEFLQRIKAMLKLDEAPEYCIQNRKLGLTTAQATLPGSSEAEGAYVTINTATSYGFICLELQPGSTFDQTVDIDMRHLFLQNMSPRLVPQSQEAEAHQPQLTHPDSKALKQLSFVLPRFGTDARKHKGAVTSIFSKNLELSINQGNGTFRSLDFQAQSVICHIDGDTRHSGHYVTIVRESEGFKEISDNKSRILTLQQAEEMVSRNGYIVNYNRLVSSSE